jgi:adenylate cyclase
MTGSLEREDGNGPLWHQIFCDGHPALVKQHRLHRILPSPPRCRLCLVPFAGIGGWVMRRRGKAPSSRNPHYCNACDRFLDAFPGGTEVTMPVLFVDVRQSTGWAAEHSPAEVSARINGFLDHATRAITGHDGFLLAFYGDCVVAVWPPGFVGPDNAAKALAAARAVRGPTPEGVGAGAAVNLGPVYISTVRAAKGLFRDVSIFGVEVNKTARLAALAGPGEVLATAAILEAAGERGLVPTPRELRGLSEPVMAATLA